MPINLFLVEALLFLIALPRVLFWLVSPEESSNAAMYETHISAGLVKWAFAGFSQAKWLWISCWLFSVAYWWATGAFPINMSPYDASQPNPYAVKELMADAGIISLLFWTLRYIVRSHVYHVPRIYQAPLALLVVSLTTTIVHWFLAKDEGRSFFTAILTSVVVFGCVFLKRQQNLKH